MRVNANAIADCLLSWFPPPEGAEVDARAVATRIGQFINVMIGANTKKG